MLVRWPSFVVKGFWALYENIYKCVFCYNHCHGMVIICCVEFWRYGIIL